MCPLLAYELVHRERRTDSQIPIRTHFPRAVPVRVIRLCELRDHIIAKIQVEHSCRSFGSVVVMKATAEFRSTQSSLLH